MKISLVDTYFGAKSNVGEYAREARKFLVNNVKQITLNHDDEIKLLHISDSLTHTLMSDLYRQAVDDKVIDNIRLMILDKADNFPSWFLISWLDLDTLILRNTDKKSADVLNSLSEYRDKILLDVTPYYSVKRKTITDTTGFFSQVIRALLVRSYETSDRMWLSPNLIQFLTKFYVMIISSKIARTYNLTIAEQYAVATAFAVFFVNRCVNNDNVVNAMMGRMDFLRMVDTKPIYDHIESNYNAHNYNLDAVVEVIKVFGPSRIANITTPTLYTMFQSLTSLIPISLIALEYPPYWCHLIISAMSGDKSSIFHSLKTLNLWRDTIGFQTEILKTQSFIRSL